MSSYEDLLEYLGEKTPEIQKATLAFEGKNVCLYWPGSLARGNIDATRKQSGDLIVGGNA